MSPAVRCEVKLLEFEAVLGRAPPSALRSARAELGPGKWRSPHVGTEDSIDPACGKAGKAD